MDTSAVQRVASRPTRDILVTRSLDGDRSFAGFGKVLHQGITIMLRVSHCTW